MREVLTQHTSRTSRWPDPRVLVSASLLIIDILLLALTLSHTLGPWRFLLGLVFALGAPGWSLVGLVDLRSAALEIGLSVAVSFALIMLCGQLMMTLHAWHPVLLEELMCAACAPSLLVQSKDLRRVANRAR